MKFSGNSGTGDALPRAACCLAVLAALVSPSATADDPAFGRVWMKLNFLASGQALPGSAIPFPPDEIDAWVRTRVPARVPGVRAPKLVVGSGSVTGSAMIDFAKVLQEEGKPLHPAIAKLVGGEHPVLVAARIESNGGRCVVTPTRVEISGVAATGAFLDLLVKTFLLPLFPEAKIGEPFELEYAIDHIDVRPEGLRVVIKK